MVLVTFLVAETEYLTPKIKGGNSQFVEVSEHIIGWLQGRVAWQRAVTGKKQLMPGGRLQVTSSNPLFVPCVLVSQHTFMEGSPHTQDEAALILPRTVPNHSLGQFTYPWCQHHVLQNQTSPKSPTYDSMRFWRDSEQPFLGFLQE